MFGVYRFVLSVLVVLQHASYPGARWSIGVFAVVQFYMLSGFVMTGLTQRYYLRPTIRWHAFYLDRFLRVYPQYIFLLSIYLSLHYWLQFWNYFVRGTPTVFQVTMNFLCIPLNYYMFIPQLETFQLIPVAWSLAAEEQFYLLFPWITARWGLVLAIYFGSLAFFVFALTGYYFETPVWAYRLLPGVAFIFLTGYCMHQRRLVTVTLGWLTVAAIWIGMLAGHFPQNPLGPEIVFGVMVAVPTIWLLARLDRRKWDDQFANAAYGIFLSHFLFIFLFHKYGTLEAKPWHRAGALIALSIIAGFAGHYLSEWPLRHVKKRIRHRAATEL